MGDRAIEPAGKLKAVSFAVLVVAYLRCVLPPVLLQPRGGGWLSAPLLPCRAARARASCRASSPLSPLTHCSLNSSLNLLNKWSLGVYGFRFPFLLTSCECVRLP